MDEIPSYLRVDIPTSDWLLRPLPGQMLIPSSHLDISSIPRSPRYTKKERRKERRRRKKEVDIFREMTFDEQMEDRKIRIKEEADSNRWHKVLNDQRIKKMKEIYNDKKIFDNDNNTTTNITTNLMNNNNNNTIKINDIRPISETPGKRFLKDLYKQCNSYKLNKELDTKIQSSRVVFQKNLDNNPISPTSPPSSRKSPKTIKLYNSNKQNYQYQYHDNDDRLIQNETKSISLEKQLKNEAISKLLSFIYCNSFINAINQRYKLLKLMGDWGTYTRAVIHVQRVFRKRIQVMRQKSAEMIRKFIINWLYKTQRTLKRRSAILIKKFLRDINEHAQLNFAIKKFQYKVKKCQRFVRSYLQCVKARLYCFRKILDKIVKESISDLCEEYTEVKISLKIEMFNVFKWFQMECLRKRDDWKVRAKNKLLAFNLMIDEDDVRRYLFSNDNDNNDPQLLKKKDKDDPYPSMIPLYSSRHLKTKLLEAFEKTKSKIIVVKIVEKKKKKEKEKKEDDILNETPQELVDRVEKFLYSLKNSTTKNKKN